MIIDLFQPATRKLHSRLYFLPHQLPYPRLGGHLYPTAGFCVFHPNRSRLHRAGGPWPASLHQPFLSLMLRTFLALLLGVALVGEAAAQTAPARKSGTATRQPSKRVRTGAANTTAAPAAGGRDDIGPGGNGAVGSTETADGKGQGVYAAPGMSVKVSDPKKVGGYNGPAPARSKTPTTLTPR